MTNTFLRLCAGFALLCTVSGHAAAQEAPEERMRDALRQAVTEMRAAQDQAAQAQADLQKAQADKAALQAQLDAANQKLSAATPAPKAPDTGAMRAQLQAAQQAGQALQQQNAQLRTNLEAQNQAASARAEDAKRSAEALKAQHATLAACEGANSKLIGVSEDILHLYETQNFRSLLVKSYEPVLGFWKVRLENIVQDYDDKIHDQEYVPPAK